MLANLIKFSKNSGNLGQNVQYFSQMAALFVAFPKYSGHSNQFATSLMGFFQKFGKFLSKYTHLQLFGLMMDYLKFSLWRVLLFDGL